MNPHDYTFVDPCEAFQHAVNAGYLTSYPTADRMVWAADKIGHLTGHQAIGGQVIDAAYDWYHAQVKP